MTTCLTITQTRDMLLHVCDAVIAARDTLTEIDSAIGDGDHGIGMSLGMTAAKKAILEKVTFGSVNEIFMLTGMTMLNTMGGASGVIFSTLFLGGLKGQEAITDLSVSVLANMMRKALDAIKARGKAAAGDKTMVDALEPAVEAMEARNNEDLFKILKLAQEAAEAGVEKTKDQVAVFGRAKSLGERALGYQDAGATSVAIIFKAMADYVSTQNN